MNIGLSIPVTHPVGAPLLMELDGQGWQTYRVDLNEDHEQATAQLREAADLPAIRFVFLLAHGTMRRLSGDPWGQGSLRAHVNDTCVKMRDLGLFERAEPPMIEIGNEPDIACDPWKEKPELLARTFRECYETIRSYSSPYLRQPAKTVRVLTPSVSNLNQRGIRYLERMYQARYDSGGLVIPDDAECAVHRYPHNGQPDLKHDGFESRDDEVKRLKEIIGGRAFHVTETGFAEYQYRGEHTSPERIADYFEREVERWERNGAASVHWYQINSSRFSHEANADEKRMATYGIRGVDGKWKPIVGRLRRMRGRAA